MKDITIVTGFFDIKRDGWKKFNRTENDYFNYFEKWAAIENKLVVYVENEDIKNAVIDCRRKYNLEDKTVVCIVKDYLNIDLDLFKKIEKCTQSKIHQSFRLQPNNPEVVNPYYDYVMLLKEWCVANSVKNNLASGTIAWVDFGFNHGGETLKPESFTNFTWKYDFPYKICLFNNKEIGNDVAIFDVIKNMNVYIMGTVIVAPDNLWIDLWEYVKEAMISLSDCGLVDDDQTILLYVYKKYQNKCCLFKSDWNKQMFDYSEDKGLVLADKNIKDVSVITRIKRRIRWFIMKYKYCVIQYKNIKPLD